MEWDLQHEPTFETPRAPRSTSEWDLRPDSHRRALSWQPRSDYPFRLDGSGQSLLSLPYSCPTSPSPSSVSSVGSSRSSAVSTRRPLPIPPDGAARFVPSRPPPPPSSFAAPTTALEEKRELIQSQGLDDLLESEDESGSSPTLSDLPAYEGRGSPPTAVDKSALEPGSRDEGRDNAWQREEEEKRHMELEGVRRRINEDSARIIEEDCRSGKERLLAQRRQEEEEEIRRNVTIEDVARSKRAEAVDAERTRIESPPPPVSPSGRDLLPLDDEKPRLRRDAYSRIESQTRRFADISPITASSLPSPPPATTYSTRIPQIIPEAHFPSQTSRNSVSLRPAPSLAFHAKPSIYGGMSDASPIFDASRTARSSAPSIESRAEQQRSLGPPSSFYSAPVGLTVSALSVPFFF